MMIPKAPTLKVEGNNLPITSVKAKGKVGTTIAAIELSQEFLNGDKLADVTYHCPLHPDWAIKSVTMKSGELEINTIVLETQQAQMTFDQAKNAGHTAVMANEVSTDDFMLQLANVPANVPITVITEIVTWPAIDSMLGTYIIPLIGGPKYSGDEGQQPYLDPDDIDAKLTGCYLDLEFEMPDASIDIGLIKDGKINSEIEPVGQVSISFGAQPNALWHEDDSGSYLVVGVPALRPDTAPQWGNTAILVDRSGSMSGHSMSLASTLAQRVINKIGDGLEFVYSFNDDCEAIWANGSAVRRRGNTDLSAVDVISHLSPRGGTELEKALKKVHTETKGKITNLVMITDMLVSEHACPELVKASKALTEDGIAVHTVVVGPAPSRFIGEAISYAGGGFYIEQTGSTFNDQKIQDCIERFLQGGSTLQSVIVDDIPLVCKHPVRGRPVMVAIDATSKPNDIKLDMKGFNPINVQISENEETRFIWAREKVMELIRSSWSKGEMMSEHKDEIVKIGIDHQISTPFTAFVGFDPSVAHDRNDIETKIAQSSLPTGIDAGGFYGVAKGGNMGVSAQAFPSQFFISHEWEQPTYATTRATKVMRSFGSCVSSFDTTAYSCQPVDLLSNEESGALEILDVSGKTATLLTAILAAINSGDDPIGEWIRDYSTQVVLFAASVLKKHGCVNLAAALVHDCMNCNDNTEATASANDIESLAEQIAKALKC